MSTTHTNNNFPVVFLLLFYDKYVISNHVDALHFNSQLHRLKKDYAFAKTLYVELRCQITNITTNDKITSSRKFAFQQPVNNCLTAKRKK